MFAAACKPVNRCLSLSQCNSMNKSRLNTYCQKAHISIAKYTTKRKGDFFVSEVVVNDIPYTSIEGHSNKKDAESDAAYVALQTLVQLHATAQSVEDLLVSVETEAKQKKLVPSMSFFVSTSKPPSPGNRPPVSIPTPPVGSGLHGSPQPSAHTPVRSSIPPGHDSSVQSRVLHSSIPPGHNSSVQSRVLHNSIPPGHDSSVQSRVLHSSIPPGHDSSVQSRVLSFGIPPGHNSPIPISLQSQIGSVSQIQPQSIPSPQKLPVTPPRSSLRSVPSMNGPSPSDGGYGMLPVSPVVARREVPVAPVSLSGRQTATGRQTAMGRQTATGIHQNDSSICPQPAVQYNFESELEKYCAWCQFLPPAYRIVEEKAQFLIVKVVVDGVEYGSNGGHDTFLLAKENAAMVAIASVGIQALQMQYKVPPQTGGKPAARSYSSSVGITEAQLSASLASLSLQQFPPVASAVASSSHPQQAPAYSIINSNSPRVSYTGGVLPPQQKAEDSIDNSQVAPGPKMSLNYKIALNTYCQKRGIPVPRYDCTYPEDAVGYIVTVHVDGRVFRSKTEGTKRAAESTAASMALQGFGESLGEAATSNGHSVKTEPIVLMKPSSIPANERIISYKNLLQEYLQKSHVSELPVYSTEREEAGFVCTVSVKLAAETQRFTGQPHPNKKAAEQTSARVACYQLNLVT